MSAGQQQSPRVMFHVQTREVGALAWRTINTFDQEKLASDTAIELTRHSKVGGVRVRRVAVRAKR